MRVLVVTGGLMLFAAGVVLTRQSGLGLGPWHVLSDGICRVSPVSFGVANILVGAGVVAIAWRLGIRPAMGTLLNVTLVGTYVDLLLAAGIVPDLRAAGWSPLTVAGRLASMLFGICLIGLGTAVYLKGGLGAGPRDALMLGLNNRFDRPIAVVRTSIEVAVLVLGILLGGAAGPGTVLYALCIGPAVGYWFRVMAVRPPTVAIAAARRA